MPTFASALDRVGLAASIAIQSRALELAAAGRKILSLAAGEPDFDTPEPVCEAAIKAIREGKTRYTRVDGIDELKDAIIEKFRRDNGLDFNRSNILVGAGGKQVIYNALRATLNPSDEVVIPAPYWVSYPDITRLCDARPIFVNTTADNGFLMTASQLDAALNANSRWLILNSPCNPSGAVYDAKALQKFADVLRNYPDVRILCDDIYEHTTYVPARFATLASVAGDLGGRILTVNGVSKTYAMTGWRIGYGAATPSLINAMRTIQSQSTGNPSSISQWAACAALSIPSNVIDGYRNIFMQRRDKVCEMLGRINGITCALPSGAFYVYPDISGCLGKKTPAGARIDSDADFARALLEEHGVATVHGGAYGLSPNIRLSYAASDSLLDEALSRLRTFCETLE
ncbi:MAG: aminotransferase [marine bacterium B5-7]|nr:MAG: aminotransferase [marine bacterium B5-7]